MLIQYWHAISTLKDTCILPLVHIGSKAVPSHYLQSSIITNVHCKLQLKLIQGFNSLSFSDWVCNFLNLLSFQYKCICELCVGLFLGEKAGNKPAHDYFCISLRRILARKHSPDCGFPLLFKKMYLFFKFFYIVAVLGRDLLHGQYILRGAMVAATMNSLYVHMACEYLRILLRHKKNLYLSFKKYARIQNTIGN